MLVSLQIMGSFLIIVSQHTEGMQQLHFQELVSPRRIHYTVLHSITSQKTTVLSAITVEFSNITGNQLTRS